MRDKHIKLIIAADGSCTIDAVNFADASCQQATQQIVQALGARVVAERHKSEARLRASSASPQTERGR
jgi:hypothetical protein